jgi:acyl carrier protein
MSATVTKDLAWVTFTEAVADVLEREPNEILTGLDFREDLELDSLGLVEMILELEESFDIDIDEKEAEAVRTTDEGFALICSYLDL